MAKCYGVRASTFVLCIFMCEMIIVKRFRYWEQLLYLYSTSFVKILPYKALEVYRLVRAILYKANTNRLLRLTDDLLEAYTSFPGL